MKEPQHYDPNCPLCNALKTEQHLFLKETPFYVILPCKTNKGHKKRIMILLKSHLSHSRFEHYMLLEFEEFCKDYFDEEPTAVICEPEFATIPDHWHIIACDWQTTDPKEAEQLRYTPHKAIKTNVVWSPENKKV